VKSTVLRETVFGGKDMIGFPSSMVATR